MADTPRPNAFTINRIGSDTGSVAFPLAPTCRQPTPGVYTFSLCPLRVVVMCDLLGRYQEVVVYGVDTVDYDRETGRLLTLDRAAAQRGIGHRTVDAETLILTTGALSDLAGWLQHCNPHAFDWRADQTEHDLIANVLETREPDLYRAGPVLPRITKASFFLDSHDDCFLLLESRDLALLQAVFGRALRIYVGSVRHIDRMDAWHIRRCSQGGRSVDHVGPLTKGANQWLRHFGLAVASTT
jgi:hypothetical protein